MKEFKNEQYSTRLDTYLESKALQQLLDNTNAALDHVVEELEAGRIIDEDITITVNGIQTAFFVSGPQVEAIYAFIKHLALENFYHVDFDEMIVHGWND